METKLYVGNLSYSATEQELQELFGQAGTVVSATIIKDRDTKRSKGFGFVEMSSQAEAEEAIKMFNGFSLSSRELTVNIARPREDRSSGGGGGGYGGYRSGGSGGSGGSRGGSRGGGRSSGGGSGGYRDRY
jgi:RNA recognition motif-containing protein